MSEMKGLKIKEHPWFFIHGTAPPGRKKNGVFALIFEAKRRRLAAEPFFRCHALRDSFYRNGPIPP